VLFAPYSFVPFAVINYLCFMELTSEILGLRPYLFRISYNMLGVIEDAEDIVQDVYEKWASTEEVKNPKAYLGRMAVNQSIDRLNEMKKAREKYVGPWLPEPYITLEPEPDPTIEYGLLFLLERLNPIERAVFILRESFSEEYSHIAELTGLSADNCRQLLHRAHEKLGRSKTHAVDPAKQKTLTEAFLMALHGQNFSQLNQVLRNDIELYTDGGGKRGASIRPIFGLEMVSKFFYGVMQLPDNKDDDMEYRPAYVNGHPAALIIRKSTGELDGMQYVEVEDGLISRMMYVRNPDKLRIRP
jgi:RNA polymerase sigma-70 factor (ECF subfamily)